MQIAHVSFLGILITLVILYLLITYISTCSPYFRYLGSISRYIFHLYLLSLSHHNLLSFSFSFWLQMAWCKSLRGHLLCANAKLVRFCEPNLNPSFCLPLWLPLMKLMSKCTSFTYSSNMGQTKFSRNKMYSKRIVFLLLNSMVTKQ